MAWHRLQCMRPQGEAEHRFDKSPAAGAEGLTASLIPCRLKPKESWVGEMVIRLHEPAEGDMAPEEEEDEAEG